MRTCCLRFPPWIYPWPMVCIDKSHFKSSEVCINFASPDFNIQCHQMALMTNQYFSRQAAISLRRHKPSKLVDMLPRRDDENFLGEANHGQRAWEKTVHPQSTAISTTERRIGTRSTAFHQTTFAKYAGWHRFAKVQSRRALSSGQDMSLKPTASS